MVNEKLRRNIILFLVLIAIILIPYVAASVITGFTQLRYDGDLSINSTTLALMTANTTRIYITQAGLVGIGTSSPTKLLSINGTLNAVTIDPSAVPNPVMNTTGNNLTISSASGSVIIRLGYLLTAYK